MSHDLGPATYAPGPDGWFEAPPEELAGEFVADVIPPVEMPTLDHPDGLVTAAPTARTSRVTDTAVPPFAAVGKLITGYSPTTASHGSAFVLGARLVFTAGHCVRGGRRVDFVPNFAPDNPGAKRWKMRFWFVHPKYTRGGNDDLRYDFAVCVTDPEDAPIADSTGSLGWLTVPPEQPECVAIGYPSDPPKRFGFDGRRMWQSRGAFVRSGSPDFRAARNDMTRGCSGGPWVVRQGDGGWAAVGLNSHVRDFAEGVMYSPVFDGDFAAMIEAAREKERAYNAGLTPADPRYRRFV